MHATHQKTEKTIDRQAIASFWAHERAALLSRNLSCVARRLVSSAKAPSRETFVVTCMDERNTHIDEALGLHPGDAEIYASGGGKIEAKTFEQVFRPAIDAALAKGRPVSIFLVPHECSHAEHLGCAAFANDREAQKVFFTDLKRALKERFPSVPVHVIAMCTTTHDFRAIDTDDHDDGLHAVLAANAKFDLEATDANHAGHGIYVGSAYRAWVQGRNAYFHLSAHNPSLAGNIEIALTVMEHHSDVDLAGKPIVLHADYPQYAEPARTAAAKENMDKAFAELKENPAFKSKFDAGLLKIVRSETDMETWKGSLVGEVG
ncbi:MAG TPA: hypothetical protein VL426_04460 [Candidatus Binatia bacterium]|nr:hypothetical protein [Candidatus Binatia bacterium]